MEDRKLIHAYNGCIVSTLGSFEKEFTKVCEKNKGKEQTLTTSIIVGFLSENNEKENVSLPMEFDRGGQFLLRDIYQGKAYGLYVH